MTPEHTALVAAFRAACEEDFDFCLDILNPPKRIMPKTRLVAPLPRSS